MTYSRSPLDTRIEIVTPENIAFQYRVAGPFTRLPAYLIDLTLRIVGVLLVGLVGVFGFGVAGVPGMGFGLLAVVGFVTEWFYGGLFEALWNGQTPGKRLLRLRVLTAEGQPINAWQAVLRNFLRGVDALPWMCYQVGLISAASNDRFQRLGDLAAGTMVVIEQRALRVEVVGIQQREALELAAQLPPGLIVSRSLARALSAYVTRRQTFSWRRRIEIALHLAEPLRLSLGLPPQTDPDQLLCAVYHHAFIADRLSEPPPLRRQPEQLVVA
ncbi:MAG TPA: RDD family protein [Pirellulales bacterium]